jgi:methionyl-tRNA synthetase
MMAKFYVTTAIDYVNGRPHLGHAYEKILADVLARYQRSLGNEVFFLTGVDEHGQKNQQSAQARGIEPQAFCDEMTGHFRGMWDRLQIRYDGFARTTDPLHKKAVRESLQKLHDKGEIYFKEHEGYYSQRQEQFVTEKDMVDGKWPEIYGDVVKTTEPNYFFKLSQYQDWLAEYIQAHPDFIFPTFRRNEVLGALEKPLNDLCISRPKSRLEWGISLPFDENYVTYVWFDALVNYVSFAAGNWPATAHVIGKDILIPAHAVYWPIMLKALGLEQPRQLIVHGWWMNRGAKMSKSVGNVVDPAPYVDRYGADALRYFVMRDMVLGQDSDFTDEKIQQRYQSDLGNDLGNLVNRTLSMLQRYRQGIVPAYETSHLTDGDRELASDEIVEEYRKAMDGYQVHAALQAVWRLIQKANQYVDQNAPWKLAKDPGLGGRLDVVLAHLAETIRRLSILVDPVLPVTAGKIRDQLRWAGSSARMEDAKFGTILQGHPAGNPEQLFPRLEEKAE